MPDPALHEFATLDEVDRDGAVREAAEAAGDTRAGLFRKGGLIAVAGLGLGALPAGLALGQSTPKSDVKILNYALTLEYLEAAFYAEAVSKGRLHGAAARFAQVVAGHEAAHVGALERRLGSKAVKKPTFDFKGTTGSAGTFLQTARCWRTPAWPPTRARRRTSRQGAMLASAGAILAVEARHAAWVRDMHRRRQRPSPAPAAFSAPQSMSAGPCGGQVDRLHQGVNQMVRTSPSCSRSTRTARCRRPPSTALRARRHPRGSFLRRSGALVAGTAAATLLPAGIAAATTPKGDVAILNFALTLEYLEAAFYKRAVKMGALNGEYQRFAKVVAPARGGARRRAEEGAREQGGQAAELRLPGHHGRPGHVRPTAITLEDTGVEAYQGQAGNIKTPAILAAALSIHPVEARHAAWIRSIAGHGTGNPSPAPEAFNPAADMATVLKAVKGTGFIVMKTAQAGAAVSGDPAMTG